jgi:hypothetical protein
MNSYGGTITVDVKLVDAGNKATQYHNGWKVEMIKNTKLCDYICVMKEHMISKHSIGVWKDKCAQLYVDHTR